MSELQTFDDRTIKRARNRFTNGKRGSGDDPIATQAKVAQDVLLGNLTTLLSRAENKAYDTSAGLQGELDGDALIDPFISYDANVAKIQDEYGVTFETYARKQQKDREATADEKSRRHAREWLSEKVTELAGEDADPAEFFRPIVEGETDHEELTPAIEDIREDFDETVFADVMAGFEAPTGDVGAPEPATGPEPATEPEPTTAEPATEPEPTTAEPTTEPEPTTAEPTAEPEPATADRRDYSGILGLGRLVIDAITANYRQGKRESMDSTAQTTEQRTLGGY
ncbi:hypothetical protein [Halanaeroarchaeum sp. HSR-CO]|uniref:hypothetical protein n=1 Tax=Halanaeroarchaeum sp. HSR-CO TaxID=2866382 RepID=UPI00217E743C|nr:hypothetical protein [Halanaeroarchaeum sp. HSR-CO]